MFASTSWGLFWCGCSSGGLGMVDKRHVWLAILLSSAISLPVPVGADQPTYEEQIDGWKRGRVAFLKSESGYLNLVGLYWLSKPVSTFGSNPQSDLVFPAAAPDKIGEFRLSANKVVIKVEKGAVVTHRGTPVNELTMRDDLSQDPVVVRSGSLAWTVINRDQNFAVRLRDFANPAIEAFEPISYFPTERKFRITGQLERYQQPRQVRVDTVIEGLDYRPQSPGLVRFEIDGQTHTLEAYTLYDGLLFVFGDRTTGRQTYPAGRFLYTAPPDDNGKVTLDFNQAENPPCAFNEFATCPVASPRNRLSVSIPAGEMYEANAH